MGLILPNLPNQIKNHFDVILGITSQAKINFHYHIEISNSLQNVTEEIYKICRNFWNETQKLYYYSCIECLMLLYDLPKKNNGGLIKFLNNIKSLPKEPALALVINDIDSFLNKINQDDFKVLCDNLREIRNKKFFHIDRKNARGEYKPMSSNNGLDKNAVKFLLKEAETVVEKLCSYFGKEAKNYLSEPKDCHYLFDELQILFSQEKLEKRLNYIENRKKYRV